MRRFLPALAALPALFLVSACEPTVDDYVQDTKLRNEKLRECSDMGMMAAKDDKYCKMAMEAQRIALKNAASNFMDTLTLHDGDDEPEAPVQKGE